MKICTLAACVSAPATATGALAWGNRALGRAGYALASAFGALAGAGYALAMVRGALASAGYALTGAKSALVGAGYAPRAGEISARRRSGAGDWWATVGFRKVCAIGIGPP